MISKVLIIESRYVLLLLFGGKPLIGPGAGVSKNRPNLLTGLPVFKGVREGFAVKPHPTGRPDRKFWRASALYLINTLGSTTLNPKAVSGYPGSPALGYLGCGGPGSGRHRKKAL